MATREEIIAEAQRLTPEGTDVRETLLNYARQNNIPFDQVDQILELDPGATAAYAAQIDATNPITQLSANYAPTDEQINENNRLKYGTADEVGFQDVVNNMKSANTGTMLTNQGTQLTNQGTQFTPEQLDASRIYFEDMGRRIDAGEDVSGLIDARRQELGLTENQLASLFTQSMGTAPSVANNAVNDYLGVQGKAPINFYSQQPMTQASPGVVPTLRPQPVQGVDTLGMMSTGFQSPVPSSITDLFNSVQSVRDINQGYLSAPRTDLSQMRSDLEAQYAAQAQAAQAAQAAQEQAMLEAQKKTSVITP
tara:strand:- start:349 stop:1275 length:927 start_codon:yes stop_codon:yes gene_type:complete